MSMMRKILLVVLTMYGTAASAQQEPHIGYLYPAGGQQGITTRIIAGGQFLRGPTDVYISGEGISASVIKYYRPANFLQKDRRRLLQKRLSQVRDKRLVEAGIDPNEIPGRKRAGKKKPKTSKKEKISTEQSTPKKTVVKPADHPLLFDLDNKSLKELEHIRNILFFPKRMKQINRQLAESVLIEVNIDPRAKPGNRELRIATRTGLTNPMVFQVGSLPEIRELEPNNKQAYQKPFNIASLPKEKPVELPVVLNGQIMPGDIDRFRFKARKGQKLVMETHARSLIPYLSDTVPGWFQATLALYDKNGKEVAFADDYRFNPDPVLFYKIPKSGEYELQIRDSIYRGREDFVYRIAVGEQPFITQVFPLGAKAYSRTVARVEGWNMPRIQVPLDTRPSGNDIQHMTCNRPKLLSSPITYAVGRFPESMETETNNTTKDAQLVSLPRIINGQINTAGDVDVFKFAGRGGDKIVAEVFARRLNSPVDSFLRLTDEKGTTLQWNDDYIRKDGHLHKDVTGLVTHHADSYFMTALPETGTFYVHLSDSQDRGGGAYGYRLRISQPQSDFALRMTPSSLSTYPGGTVVVQVYVLRKDGFDGEINIVLKDAPEGFKLEGGRIPAGCNKIRMTLTTPLIAPATPVSLELEGGVVISNRIVTRPVVPADDIMQAFLYRHLVPSQQLLISIVRRGSPAPLFEVEGDEPVRLIRGGSAQIRCRISKRKVFNNIELKLNQPPQGLTLHDVKVASGILSFTLKADKDKIKTPLTDNLIIEAFREFTPKQKGKKTAKKRRVSIGFLPAIPIQIVN